MDAPCPRQALSGDDLVIWEIPIGLPADRLPLLESQLSETEREMAHRFRFERDRIAYAASHAALRAILAQHLGGAPSEVRFRIGPHGKPELTGSGALAFNLSHSGDRALVAVAGRPTVGVDLERIDATRGTAEAVSVVFAPEEQAALQALDVSMRIPGFFRLWARKEAFLKALGTGLGTDLNAFAVSLDEGNPRLLRVDPALSRVPWTLGDLAVEGYAAAFAVPGGPVRVVRQAWAW